MAAMTVLLRHQHSNSHSPHPTEQHRPSRRRGRIRRPRSLQNSSGPGTPGTGTGPGGLRHATLLLLLVLTPPSVLVPTGGAEAGGDDDDCRASFAATTGPPDAASPAVAVGGSCERAEEEEERGRQHRTEAGAGGPGPGPPWRWDPDAPHRCSVRRIPIGDLPTVFGGASGGLVPPLYREPIVIDYRSGDENVDTDTNRVDYNGEFARMTSLDNITRQFEPGFEVTLSSSNSFSQHRRVVTLEQYIHETTSTETLPSHLSNETWYLFGETYTDPWVDLLRSYRLPPCQTCTRDLSALAFGIGNRGSGVQWHVHGPGFSESLHGRKHWVMYPPDEKPKFDANFTSRHWMEVVYPTLHWRRLPHECTLHPGEVIYFPDGWYHATVNLDDYTAFVSTFTTEHL